MYAQSLKLSRPLIWRVTRSILQCHLCSLVLWTENFLVCLPFWYFTLYISHFNSVDDTSSERKIEVFFGGLVLNELVVVGSRLEFLFVLFVQLPNFQPRDYKYHLLYRYSIHIMLICPCSFSWYAFYFFALCLNLKLEFIKCLLPYKSLFSVSVISEHVIVSCKTFFH